jgi:hypothetical protein
MAPDEDGHGMPCPYGLWLGGQGFAEEVVGDVKIFGMDAVRR